METINYNEELIGFNVTEFNKLTEIQEKLTPQKNLWNLISNFKKKKTSWTKETNIFKLDPEDIER